MGPAVQGESPGTGGRLGEALALPLVSCVALGKLLTLSASSFPLSNMSFMIPASWDRFRWNGIRDVTAALQSGRELERLSPARAL